MMKDNDDKAFNAWMENRRFEEPSAGLATRIIRAAAGREQRAPFSLGGFLRRTFQEFHLPSPAYALAVVLLIGFAVGANAPSATADSQDDSEIQTLLYMDGGSL
ncbi:MAG: hypothetical protein J0L97_08855 [Alphaproteobacteria bacterium]|nr:hypothetical protein [Alphaproteobacteria bacterium]